MRKEKECMTNWIESTNNWPRKSKKERRGETKNGYFSILSKFVIYQFLSPTISVQNYPTLQRKKHFKRNVLMLTFHLKWY